MEQEIKRGENLFAQGRFEEAEDLFLELLTKTPNNADILNNLGVVCHSLARSREAEIYLGKALAVEPAHEDALLNLQNLREEVGGFEGAAINKPKDAVQLGSSSREKKTDQGILICCLPGLDSFVDDLILGLRPSYRITKLVSNRLDDFLNALPDYDVVWLEWGNQLAEALTRKASSLLTKKRVICRIHSYEVLDGFADRLDFSLIDDLVFVAPHIRDILVKRQPTIAKQVGQIHIIPNGIDLSRFTFSNRSRGYNIAYLGSINYKKGPMLLLHAFWNLVQQDDRYRLFIGGNYQDLRYKLYFEEMIQTMGLTRQIRMDGWVKDVSLWLQDKHVIICTSVMEGHPVGVLEAMACGLKPAIHTFVGARNLYPERYLWKSIPEFVQIVTSGNFDPKEYRNFVKEGFSLEGQLASMERIISGSQREKAYSTRERSGYDHVNRADQNEHEIRLPASQHVTTDDSRRFYNDFLDRLKQDHLRPNPRHARARQSLTKIIHAGMKVLDVGCGTGITSHFMASLGAYVTGVDLSDRLISYANEKSSHPNIRYLVQDATKLSLGEAFDVITIIDSMEHIIPEDLDNLFQVISRHSSERTIIYLNLPDARFQRFMKENHPEKLQLIDEGQDVEGILSLFRSIGFEASDIKIYGIDTPVQYNEYTFRKQRALDGMYHEAFLKAWT